MPNGGHICCDYCTYGRRRDGRCDIHGVETSPGILCRAFRPPGDSHTKVRKQFPLLLDLEPGVVYGIDNDTFVSGNPRPKYRMRTI